MVCFIPDYQLLVGILIAAVLGMLMPMVLNAITKKLKKPPFENADFQSFWDAWINMGTGGKSIGFVDLVVFFSIFWIGAGWELGAAYLALKIAIYWKQGVFGSIDFTLPTLTSTQIMLARSHVSRYHGTRFLLGTGFNIAIAIISVAIAKSLQFYS